MNFCARSGEDLAIVSVLTTPSEIAQEGDNKKPQHLALIRVLDHDDDQLLFISSSSPKEAAIVKGIKEALASCTSKKKWDLKQVKQPEFIRELTQFEDKCLFKAYKFGVVLLRRHGSSAEEDLYNFKGAHIQCEHFLSLIADRVCLKGFELYGGGLDCKRGSTGTESFYASFHGLQIMFHVAHLIPFTPNDPQQVERKRHVGNDIVVIVFRELGAAPFDPSVISSQFNLIFMVVTPIGMENNVTVYSISVVRNDSLPSFRPALRQPAIYREDEPTFRDTILCKLINAERAAFASQHFRNKLTRTRKELLQMMYRDYSTGSVRIKK